MRKFACREVDDLVCIVAYNKNKDCAAYLFCDFSYRVFYLIFFSLTRNYARVSF